MRESPHPNVGRRRFRTRPTKAGAVALGFGLFFFIIGTNVSSGWLLLMASLCVTAPVVSCIRSIYGVRGVMADREPICRGSVGSEMRYRITVRSVAGRLSQLVLTDQASGARPAVVMGTIPKGGARAAEVSAIPEHRGWFEDPPINIECAAPLGLWSTRRVIPCSGSVEIAPAIPPVRVPWRAGGTDPLSEGLTDPPRRGAGLDFLGLREYRPGDSFRHIHWASSARRDDLVVREFQQEGVRPLVVTPDVSAPGAATERAISIAGSLVRDAVTHSMPVWLALPDGSILESPHIGALGSALARIDTGLPFINVTGLLASRRIPLDPLVVAVSGNPGVASAMLGPAAAVVLIATASPAPVAGRYPVWYCPLEGEACLAASSLPSAA